MKLLDALHYRLKVYTPRALALMTHQLPLEPVDDLYTPVPPLGRPIPNVVYQTWRDTRFGRSHRDALRAFRALNPSYSFEFFDDAALDRYMTSAYAGTEIEKIYRAGRFGPLKTDIWRYCILLERGGVYCDIGKGFNTPFATFIPPEARGVIAYERDRTGKPLPHVDAPNVQHPALRVVNWALAFAPGHPLLARVIDGIVSKYPLYAGKVSADPKWDILNFTGPVHFTECVHAYAAETGMSDIHEEGVDFEGKEILELPGAYVRYVQRKSYITARNQPIVD